MGPKFTFAAAPASLRPRLRTCLRLVVEATARLRAAKLSRTSISVNRSTGILAGTLASVAGAELPIFLVEGIGARYSLPISTRMRRIITTSPSPPEG
jgi:hypothetical protein